MERELMFELSFEILLGSPIKQKIYLLSLPLRLDELITKMLLGILILNTFFIRLSIVVVVVVIPRGQL